MMYRAVSVYWISVLLVPSVAQQMPARVVNGTADAGRLEILYDGTWGTVCDDGFGQAEALVACRMLGYNSTTAVAVGSDKYGVGSGPILLDDLQCEGNETSLAQCKHPRFYTHDCQHSEDVGVACNIISAQQMSARVVGGTADAGRLEILYNGTWSTVCGIMFRQEEALVACRMLGFNSTTAVAVGSDKYGAGSGPILFSDLQCEGNETSLAQCPHRGVYIHDCTHWHDVGVMCNFPQQMSARVVGGTAAAGRLEILYDGTWSTVCGYKFGQREALVACRMLGFNSTTAVAVGSVKYGEGSGLILFDLLQCVGNETSLAQCKHWGLYKQYCHHLWDVGVMCNNTQQMSARVVGGTADAGRLEILYDGTWSTVCGNRFGQREALVACRMLGFYSTTAVAVGSAKYGAGSGPILFDVLQCVGNETSLEQCQHSGFYKQYFGHSYDVGVMCNITDQMTARLAGGTSQAGRLEIFFNGEWSTVCNKQFGQEEAEVACRMMGFKSGGAAAVSPRLYGQVSGHILLNNVVCQGTETSLTQCQHSGLYTNACNHSRDVGVVCNITNNMSARLVHGTSAAGRLEILFNQEWTTVCDRGFGQEEAQVACRMLGFNSTGAAAVSSVVYGAGSGHIFLDELNCKGTETNLEICSNSMFYLNSCKHSNDVGIVCDIELRLTGTSRTRQDLGLVEMKTGSTWQAVCVSDVTTATVACRQLRLPTGAAVHTGALLYEARKIPVLEVSFTCEGHENNLFHCGQNVDGYKSECDDSDVGVFCTDIPSVYIVSANDSYPLMAGNKSTLRCLTPNSYTIAEKPVWSETAGGRPDGDLLIFEPLTRTHNMRRVTCNLTSVKNISGDSLVLNVYYEPVIRISPMSNVNTTRTENLVLYEITQGQDVIFVCKADSNPPSASITWRGIVSSDTGELSITAADNRHSGTYTCTVTTETVDGDDRLPLKSSHRLIINVKGFIHHLSLLLMLLHIERESKYQIKIKWKMLMF
ncbi:deleted in malignant brain tumors 1 protein-like isoform X2 [Pomacea canaliculata]|uniref:deleted in malignant brain tumors 1 protein-like isoform X2 n=1 Tax=Pomacea canaliculata TaxID=400727 RepID=UPI000D738A5D|nr:deleted in malignant brain tumors 1 protein-like isoform X2 [Pomacea canaliculata]